MSSSKPSSDFPALIQGGMGVAISSYPLAQKVARRGHMGVVSGTAVDRLVFVRLQHGDPSGDIRRALAAFPDQDMAKRVLERHFRPDGQKEPGKYDPFPIAGFKPNPIALEAGVVGGFCEVWLAKEGHDGVIGINLLEKIQIPNLPILYGAMLAGIDYVLMGAGIPREIPGHIDRLSRHEVSTLKINIEDGSTEPLPFDPSFVNHGLGPIAKPRFLAIISTHVLAMALSRVEGVDGFIVEHHCAGGHNAPPRGWSADKGADLEYGDRDVPDFDRIKGLGKPYYLAGGQDHAGAIAEALESGAAGIQVGTAFAFCSDSGMDRDIRRRALVECAKGTLKTKTEGRGSPTGFPFKVLDLEGTAGAGIAEDRPRQVCQLGYLRTAYRKENNSIGWRCAAEPVDAFLAKGGKEEDLQGRRCVCNGLLATVGLGYTRKDGLVEPALVTAGDLRTLSRFIGEGDDYDANDVIDVLEGIRVPAS
ncbi:MAG: nitronate monooxygenase [Planctomycetota bacterium]|jgi:NAD(P)H-dependent flavin oxidoreductase YrpB (nitropropane dioxygenase family)|nr:nitronate monooxygenase [Planctomycetota bacterium]